jgi:hypothetical protein
MGTATLAEVKSVVMDALRLSESRHGRVQGRKAKDGLAAILRILKLLPMISTHIAVPLNGEIVCQKEKIS